MLSEKMEVLKLQEEKVKMMKKDVEIEEKICDIKDRLDTLMIEKEKIDKINADIDVRLEKFNHKYQKHQTEQEDILRNDTRIEESQLLAKTKTSEHLRK